MIKPQGAIIPFNSDKWHFVGSAKVENYLGQQAVHLGIKEQGKFVNFGMVVLKGMDFHNGIIEYDILFDEKQQYPGINFRQQGQGDFERFYMRPHESGSPDANSYIPVFNGVQSWQLYAGDQFSSHKKYKFNEWQHIKLVVNENIADIYIGDMQKPELTVELRHTNKSGTISLYGLTIAGDVRFANFAIKKMEFGFSDKVKLYHNNHIIFEGSDVFQSRDHIFLGTVGFYDAVYLNLKKGNNELLFAIREDNSISTSGWGVQARFENMDGITIKTN